MKRSALFALAVGLVLLLALVLRHGPSGILAALAVAGWSMLWVAAYHLLPLFMDTLGWAMTMPRGRGPGLSTLLPARWVAESFNTLLPVAQVGGHVARARMAAGRGGPDKALSPAESGATVTVDVTLGLVTQFAFALAGVLATLPYLGASGDRLRLLGGAGLGIVLLAGFVLAQRAGMFTAAAQILQSAAPGRRLSALLGEAKAMDRHIRAIYAARGRLVLATGLRLLGWLSKSGESWLALHFLGVPATFGDALALEALSTAATSAAFMVPGGLGVREGSILLLGRMLGITPEVALALALIKRAREIILGAPGLAVWLWIEARDWQGRRGHGHCGAATGRTCIRQSRN